MKLGTILDDLFYPTGVEVPDAAWAVGHLSPERFPGDWNYFITLPSALIVHAVFARCLNQRELALLDQLIKPKP